MKDREKQPCRIGYSYGEEVAYSRGFKDGYLEGERKGLEIATTALAMQSPAPIIVTCKDKAEVEMFVKRFKGQKDASKEDADE